MSELPLGWVETTFGEICGNGQYGWTSKASSTGKIKYIRTTDITKGPINWESVPYCLDVPDDVSKYQIKENDILISRAGSVGFNTLIKNVTHKAVFASYLIRYVPSQAVNENYASYLLNTKDYWDQISQVSSGVAMANVNAKKLAELSVPLAPLPEQKRIADKLDILLARVDATREGLDRIPNILKQFRRSILASATCGKLTEEWRAINVELPPETAYAASLPPKESIDIPETWRWVSVRELSSKVTDGVHKKPNYIESGIPFLSIKNLTSGEGIDFSKTNYVSESDHKEFCKRTKPEKDDILITKDGTLGVIRRIDSDVEFSIFVSLALVKLKDKATAKYIEIAFNSPVVQKQLVGVGTGLLHIHLKDLREDVVPIPPKREQEEIVRRVEKLLSFADNMAARYKTARTQVDKLTPALLAKAFRGELVEQDPNDEPAEKLLERIKANNKAASPTKKAPTKKAARRK